MGRPRLWKDSGTLPAELVPKDMLADGSYRRSGYNCWACSWRTDKTGYSGRQATRAHSRVHAYDRRAWRRPLAAAIALAVLAACFAAAGHVGVLRLEPLVDLALPSGIRLGVFAGPIATATVVAGAILVGWDSISPAMLWTLRSVVALAMLPILATVAIELGVVDIEIGRLEFGLAALCFVIAASFGCAEGWIRLQLRRRMRQPSGYTELATAENFDAEFEFRRRASAAARRKAEQSEGSSKGKSRSRAYQPGHRPTAAKGHTNGAPRSASGDRSRQPHSTDAEDASRRINNA